MSRRRALYAVLALVAGLLLFLLRDPIAAWFRGPARDEAVPASAGSQQTVYTCPMHPHVRQHGPGKCPMCGMDLVAVARTETS